MDGAENAGDREKKKASGTEARKRPGIIGFRVSGEERAEIEAAAERAGLSTGSYVRARILTAPKTRAVKKPPIERALLAKLLGQLGKAGGNIHQIVKRMNYKECVESAALLSALADYRESAAAIMQAMGRQPP